METRAAFLLTMEVALLLGKQECNVSSDEEVHLLRLLTPIAKLYTAKQVSQVQTSHEKHVSRLFHTHPGIFGNGNMFPNHGKLRVHL